MSNYEDVLQSLRPSPKRLYEATERLVSCLKSHKEAGCSAVENPDCPAASNAEKPTLSALARHYRLQQILKTLAPLVVLQERLFRRLEKRPEFYSAVRGMFPGLFHTMDRESRAIQKIAANFSVEKEDRHIMETNINHIRESLERILDAFKTVSESRYNGTGHLHNNMADIVDAMEMDWSVIQMMRDRLPEHYPLNFGVLSEKTST